MDRNAWIALSGMLFNMLFNARDSLSYHWSDSCHFRQVFTKRCVCLLTLSIVSIGGQLLPKTDCSLCPPNVQVWPARQQTPLHPHSILSIPLQVSSAILSLVFSLVKAQARLSSRCQCWLFLLSLVVFVFSEENE